MPRMKYVAFSSLLVALGCSGETGPSGDGSPDLLSQHETFVPISRTLSSDASIKAHALRPSAVPGDTGKESFYLAINKKELNQRYFLSAYMKQAYPGLDPGAYPGGSAMTLGTRVVTFRVQNGKLFVFDAQDGRASSDTFDPSVIVEAYPLVDGYAPFDALPGHEEYVLIDPAAGLNRFGAVSDVYATGTKPLHFQIDLTYLQNFRRISDGGTFEEVFTGAINDSIDGEPTLRSQYRLWGTLGLALRRYTEGEGFQPLDAATVSKRYFLSQSDRGDFLLRLPNTGKSFDPVTKWNIHPGMKPIPWLISDQFVKVAQKYPKYDILGVIKSSIENWNEAFGFKALEAKMASPEDSYADDDKNYFIYDADPTVRGALADYRINPNTGEIRGASVYLGAMWVTRAIEAFDPPPGAAARATSHARPKVPQITWGDFRHTPACNLVAGSEPLEDDLHGLDAHAFAGGTPAENVEKFIRQIATHQIGHTLGLQHNFKGSLLPLPQQNSVMETMLDGDKIDGDRDRPGLYDRDAIRFLYGLSSSEPSQPFCTDEETAVDPECAAYDRTEVPLAKHWGPTYNLAVRRFLEGTSTTMPSSSLNGTAAFLRAGTEVDQDRAWGELDKLLAVGVDHTADNAAYPGYTARLSEVQKFVLDRLFFAPAGDRGAIDRDPTLTGATATKFLNTLKHVIVNSDTYRGWDTRRTSVDVLKKLQTQGAYEALLSARATLASTHAPAGSSDAALTRDLVARIDGVTSPYFLK